MRRLLVQFTVKDETNEKEFIQALSGVYGNALAAEYFVDPTEFVCEHILTVEEPDIDNRDFRTTEVKGVQFDPVAMFENTLDNIGTEMVSDQLAGRDVRDLFRIQNKIVQIICAGLVENVTP